MMLAFFGLSNLLHPRRFVHLIGALLGRTSEENFSEQALRTKLQGPMSAKRQSAAGDGAGTARERVDAAVG